jgi:hypothetical protein
MHMQNTPLWALLLLISTVSTVAQSSSAQQKPFKVPFSYSFGFSIPCSYGDLQGTETFTGIALHRVDAAGNLISISSHETVITTFVNPLNGKSATGVGVENDTFPYVAGQEQGQITRGAILAVTVPGVGQLRLSGRVVYDFTNGFSVTFTPKAFPDDTFNAALCAALE